MLAQYQTNLKYRKLDENGDMVFGHGDDDFHYGLDAMRQVIQTRLNAVADEWWEGDATAIPYFTEILGGSGSLAHRNAVDLMIIERIMDTIGVISVSDVVSTYNNRKYTFSCRIQTVYGETSAEVNIP